MTGARAWARRASGVVARGSRLVWWLLSSWLVVRLRRWFQGPRHPDWSFRFEWLNLFTRRLVAASWAGRSVERQRALLGALPPSPRFLRRVTVRDVAPPAIAAKWYEPPGAASERRALYLHGGGYVLHLPGCKSFAAALAMTLKARTLVPEYRLAPEHPFPAAIEDACSAYEYLLGCGTAPEQIVVVGDSAGAGLAMALLQKLREAGKPLPRLAVLVSPWLELSPDGPAGPDGGGYDFVSAALGQWWASLYLAGHSATDPLCSPLHADLAGLPPLYVQAGDAEVLLEQVRAFERRAREAGVDCRVETWPGMTHNFHFLADVGVETAHQALQRLGEHVDASLALSPSGVSQPQAARV